MKRSLLILLTATAALGGAWAGYQTSLPEPAPLSHFAPSGALLYLQAKDFGTLLADWNSSSEKKEWIRSSNYEVFSRSRLFLRLKNAGNEFAAAAGLSPDANFLSQIAGKQSTVALYDIGELKFLFITRLPSASAMQSALWQTRSKFEPRTSGGVTFFVHADQNSGREVAFAVAGDYLLLATKEDLLAGALQLMAGGEGRSIEAEAWWSDAVQAAAREPGDLRLVLNLEKIVPSPYFRSYWVQRNVTEMKQYRTAVTDLYRSRSQFREERVLLRKTPLPGETAVDGANAVAEMAALLPSMGGFYQSKANPSPEECFALLETKILAPHIGPAPPEKLAHDVQLTSEEVSSGADLETRIDISPVAAAVDSGSVPPLQQLLKKNPPRAVLHVQSTAQSTGSIFIRFQSAVAIVAASDWNESEVQAALTGSVRSAFTASDLGLGWQSKSGYQQMDGLWSLSFAVRGKYLLIGDDSEAIAALLSNLKRKASDPPAALIAGFNRAQEHGRFSKFAGSLEQRSYLPGNAAPAGQNPLFFADNVQSLSSALSGVSSEKIVVRESPEKVAQTVTYEWSH